MIHDHDTKTTTDWTPGRMAFDPPSSLKTYLLDHTTGFSPVFRRLYDETTALGEPSVMMLGHEQVAFFQLIASLMRARRVLDLGTFTGISALAFASAIEPDGQVITVDRNPAWIDFARPFWKEAGVGARIEAQVGEADQVMSRLREERTAPFDIIFVDVDKANTTHYVFEGLELLTEDGMILVDNALWHGWVLNTDKNDADTQGMRLFNERIRTEPDIDVAMLPLGDGLTVVRRRTHRPFPALAHPA